MLSDLAIKRPVLALVTSLLIVVFGIASLLDLPTRELPDIDYPTVTVVVGYQGAAPEVVDTEIVETIEGAIAGIAGVRIIESRSNRGSGWTVITFSPGRNIDEAANDVRDAVGRVRGSLPEDADEPYIAKSDDDDDPVMRIGVVSDRMGASELTDYAERFIVDRLATLDGVASVDIFGNRRYAVRIWLDRQAMAARNLTVGDVEAALDRSNLERPAGELRSETRQFQIRTVSRLDDVDDFRNLVISRIDGYPVRLADVARVELGAEDEDTVVRANGESAIGLGVLRQSSANTIEIADAVGAELDALRPTLPAGMTVEIASNDALFIEQSIREVLRALVIALALVVLVIFAFLASIRATLVPAVTIPVAVIGAFIGIYALDFSINVLTLLALILAIGLVVDDAIVVLENAQRRIDLGETPLVASALGTRQVTFAVLATSATLIAVFLPLSFMQGQIGRLFREFGFVLAIAVAISTFVALTLCPMLCSHWLKPGAEGSSVRNAVHAALDRLTLAYRRLLQTSLDAPLIVLTIACLVGAASYWLYLALPKELAPKEDRGVIFVSISAPQGATVGYSDKETRKVEAIVQPLLDSGDAQRVFAIIGRRSAPNRAFVVVRLAEWDERTRDAQAISRDLIPKLREQSGMRAVATTPSGLGLRGSRTPLRLVIGGPDYASVQAWADQMAAAAEANPGLRDVDTDFEQNLPQVDILIDRERADDLGISVEAIATTLQTMLASREVTTYVDRGREYEVILQAEEDDRRTPGDLTSIFLRAGESGELAPLGALVRTEERASAPTLRRFDRLPSVTISAALNEGYDLGSAITYMQEKAEEILPLGAKLGYAGQTEQYLETTGGVFVTFALALLIVYLVLAAQFESFIHPAIIMLTLPLATSGALASLWLAGSSLNIYSQVGLILLVGLMAKNGILIVEFANQLRDDGHSIRDAILDASAIRLRPIVMTVLSTMLGALPLALATGAGAESRQAIGLVIIGGLGIASLMTLVVTPVLYDLLAGLARPRKAIERELETALAAKGEIDSAD
ncbi:MAG: efflux RND transporter permease subunit [Pseudomonadota bacterium]